MIDPHDDGPGMPGPTDEELAAEEWELWLIEHDAPELRPDGCSWMTAEGVLL